MTKATTFLLVVVAFWSHYPFYLIIYFAAYQAYQPDNQNHRKWLTIINLIAVGLMLIAKTISQ